jgi:hypothetical protein
MPSPQVIGIIIIIVIIIMLINMNNIYDDDSNTNVDLAEINKNNK